MSSEQVVPAVMSSGLQGRVAVVTGAGGSIGLAYARALAEAGAQVAILDVDEGAARNATEALRSDGHTVAPFMADVSSPEDARAAAVRVRDELGPVGVLVNNAAIYRAMRLDAQMDVDIDYWRRVFSVNLDGPLLMTQAFAPQMIEVGWGRVVMQSSVAAYSGGGGAYGVSKLALLGLTRGFARELGTHGITVNGIAPGPILNEATRDTVPQDRIERLIAAAPLQRGGQVDDLVGSLLFLCSDASSWMTGQTLIVDGGTTVRY